MKHRILPRLFARSHNARALSGLTAAVAAIVLASCASAPLPDSRIDLPPTWRNASSATAGTRAVGAWWRAFGDPRLDALIEEAMRSNLDVEQASARLRAARTLYRHANDEFLPTLRARTNDEIDPDASASFVIAGFDAIWELGWFGRAQGARRIAQGDAASAESELRDARVSVAAEVARNWIQLRNAQQREALLSRIGRYRQEQSKLVAKRVSLRLASPQQSALSQAASANADAALSGPRQDEIAAAQALALLLGRAEPDPSWSQPGEAPQLRDWRGVGIPADVLRSRPDIARSEAEVLRAAGERDIAHAERFPNIGIGGTLQWSANTDAKRDVRSAEGIGGVGPVLDIPLFDWGLRKAREQAKSETLQASALAYRKTVLNAVAEVETALGNVEQQRLAQEQASLALRAMRQAYDAAEARYKLGLASRIDALDAEAERDRAELAVLDARSAHTLAYVALNKALGGGSDVISDDAADEHAGANAAVSP